MPYIWLLDKISPTLDTTDSRESIYAFLGLQTAGDSFTTADPNCELDYDDVLVGTATTIIRKSGSLNVLAYADREGKRRGTRSALPLWVTNWKKPVASPTLTRGYSGQLLTADSGHHWLGPANPHQLRVRAIRLVEIDVVFKLEFCYRTPNWYEENITDYLVLYERLQDTNLSAQCPAVRLLKVMVTLSHSLDIDYEDFDTLGNITIDEMLEAYDEYLEAVERGDNIEETRRLRGLRYYTYLINIRHLFLTRSGCLGHVSRPAPDDIICALEGCSHPIVLKHWQGNQYILVGVCSVENFLGHEKPTEEYTVTFLDQL